MITQNNLFKGRPLYLTILFSLGLAILRAGCNGGPATVTASPSVMPGTLILVNGMLVDGTGTQPVRDAVIVIRDDRILAAGARSQVSIPAGARMIDVGGATILPGFINAHVHNAYNAKNLEA